ncbi:MAG: molybdenum cofactor biosynthesis protein MoaE [Actinobacteria bacterium]|nr:molybdenum cofactor biosynthesis protein MoaE [Actinomycetota bacterium]
MAFVRVEVVDKQLDVAALVAEASAPSCGAIATFVGTVRESASVAANSNKAVTSLDYEAHPTLAKEQLREIATRASDKWDLESVVAVHRVGTCELGEPTVVVACAAAHRGEALDACRWLIDELKATVPIWKKEIYADGSSWVDAHA